MAIPQTKQMFIDRVKTHLNNNYASSSFSITDNQILLYIDETIPVVMRSLMFHLMIPLLNGTLLCRKLR